MAAVSSCLPDHGLSSFPEVWSSWLHFHLPSASAAAVVSFCRRASQGLHNFPVSFRRVYHDLSDDYCCYCGGHYFHGSPFRGFLPVLQLLPALYWNGSFCRYCFCRSVDGCCFCLRSDDCYCFYLLMTVIISLPPLSLFLSFCGLLFLSPPEWLLFPRFSHCCGYLCFLPVYCLPTYLLQDPLSAKAYAHWSDA